MSGEATKRNEENRSVLPCHGQTSFKRLVQEKPNGKEHHKHNHEKYERGRELTADISKDLRPKKN